MRDYERDHSVVVPAAGQPEHGEGPRGGCAAGVTQQQEATDVHRAASLVGVTVPCPVTRRNQALPGAGVI